MWDDRYSSTDYAYGTEANTFLVEHAHKLHGPVLSLAEGEGRNAVYLASLGLSVLGVDSSEVGLDKAEKLAIQKRVQIQTQRADLASFTPIEGHYGAVISIYAHLPSKIRQTLYPLVEKSLQPGGIFLLEAYSEDQITRNTGGPKDTDMLMSAAKISGELPSLRPILLRKTERNVVEGSFHTGLASVVQFIGVKDE